MDGWCQIGKKPAVAQKINAPLYFTAVVNPAKSPANMKELRRPSLNAFKEYMRQREAKNAIGASGSAYPHRSIPDYS
jgi:hypothetical protein